MLALLKQLNHITAFSPFKPNSPLPGVLPTFSFPSQPGVAICKIQDLSLFPANDPARSRPGSPFGSH